jgi:hypothetical protein
LADGGEVEHAVWRRDERDSAGDFTALDEGAEIFGDGGEFILGERGGGWEQEECEREESGEPAAERNAAAKGTQGVYGRKAGRRPRAIWRISQGDCRGVFAGR